MLNKKDNPTAESKWYGINWAKNAIAELPAAELKLQNENERVWKTDEELLQEEISRIAWCKGFNAGVDYAKEYISLYIKEMGYVYEMPKAYELDEELKGE